MSWRPSHITQNFYLFKVCPYVFERTKSNMLLINGCYLISSTCPFGVIVGSLMGTIPLELRSTALKKTCTKSVGRNILRWNVEAEQIGGIHIATKVHSIA
jgi:hypothetical protein